MKKLLYFFATALIISSCGQPNKTSEEAQEVKEVSTEAKLFSVDTENSTLNWEGAKITETIHYGTINISEGFLAVKDGQIDAGNFTIDMSSLTDLDLTEDSGKLKLEGHLKSPDFFNVEAFPTAVFEITGVEAIADDPAATHKITGNLTIKDITNSISFPANVSISETMINAKASMEIKRNEWDVVWGGSKTEQGIKDFLQNNLIKDEFVIVVDLKAGI